MNVTVYQGVMGFQVRATPQGRLKEGKEIDLYNFLGQFIDFIWDQKVRRYLPGKKYMFYNKRTQRLYLPTYALEAFTQYVQSHGDRVVVERLSRTEGAKIQCTLKPGVAPRDEKQQKTLEFLTNPASGEVRGVELQPGCVVGDTLVAFHHQGFVKHITIQDAYDRWDELRQDPTFQVVSNMGEGVGYRDVAHDIQDVVFSGWRHVVTITFHHEGSGVIPLRCTPDHPVWVYDPKGGSRWVEAQHLVVGMRVLKIFSTGREDLASYGIIQLSVVFVSDPSEEKVRTYDIQCKDPHHNFYANGVLVHNSGKTFLTIATIAHIQRRALVRVNGLLDQWKDAIHQFSTLEDDQVMIVKGGPSVAKLLKGIESGKLDPAIILSSVSTLMPYALDKDLYENYPSFDEFCERCDIGITVVDEAHKQFHANYNIDLRLNPQLMIPLTATFMVSQQKVKSIFDQHYPEEIRYGAQFMDRYVKVVAHGYRTGYNDIPSWACKVKYDNGMMGYSQAQYENYLLKFHRKLTWIYNTVYTPAINEHFILTRSSHHKLLIIASTVEMCEWLKGKIIESYPDLSVLAYYSGSVDEQEIRHHDVIVSTVLSSGTGRDIPDLKMVLCTISVRSEPTNLQLLGRLRKLPDTTPVFVYTYNMSVQAHVDHHLLRQTMYSPRALSFDIRAQDRGH